MKQLDPMDQGSREMKLERNGVLLYQTANELPTSIKLGEEEDRKLTEHQMQKAVV